MIYTEYWKLRTNRYNYKTGEIEDCKPYLAQGLGSTSVPLLDDRNSLHNQIEDAKIHMNQYEDSYNMKGFRIIKAESISHGYKILYEHKTKYEYIEW